MPSENNTFLNSVNQNSQIPILSFFTGAGFLDIGFMQAGFKTIWCNEYDKNFVKSFEYGLASLTGIEHSVSNTSSIIELGPNQIAREAFNNTQIPEVFGMIGGPPCPDFSVGGKNRGREGDHGKLSQVYVNRIIELQPTFFLFENVPGLLRTAKHREFFKLLREQLSADYITDFRVLNALDFGVPQDRERVIMIGVKKKWLQKKLGLRRIPSDFQWFEWPEDERYNNAKTRFEWPEATPFGGEPDKPELIPDELMVGSIICNLEEMAQLPNGLESFIPLSDKFMIIPEGDVSRKSFKRLHRWRYSPTAAYGNNEVHLHPTQPRRLTVREALRIQSVPDMYIMPDNVPLTHKFKTIGNGVAVKLANAVAESIRKMIEEEPNDVK
ncbi:DNA cytosine methyltransferase [Paenibacillus rhizophilus]|uniref:DNA (cytosine-5-)-methyltransferase n=1 Tax=Paenibacillus rhizophilus TaxID=1850366 RepID=A0A3N9PUB2_9BACL|nr:DNA cytosine methyltransferase [Paenibacillus rhizophilus]RQW08836.1 DNA cytosine methyltransferase [Paenibacillus rhizophilus]